MSRVRTLVFFVLALAAPLAALARPPPPGQMGAPPPGQVGAPPPPGLTGSRPASVPEFDPSVAGTIATLLVGASVAVAARRRRR